MRGYAGRPAYPLSVPSALGGLDRLGGLGQHLEEVSHHTEVGELEDRGLPVLVDRDDGLRGLHAGTVLDGTGDATGDVQLGRDLLAGLPDLGGVRVPAGVDCGPRR